MTAAFFTQLFFPDVSRFGDPEAASPEIALFVGGKLFQAFFLAGTLSGTLASGLASHASVSRLLYVMGRDQMIPKKLFGFIYPNTIRHFLMSSLSGRYHWLPYSLIWLRPLPSLTLGH